MKNLLAIATRGALAVGLLLCAAAPSPARAAVSVSIGAPSIDIGIHFGALPALTVVPGTPVYYAPSVDANFFFYDGMYWVYQGDHWYASSWYNGPWALVDPEIVPVFILQVPVRYYRRPPEFFHGWARNAAPHWDEHWGHDWAGHHVAWSHVDKSHVPRPAPIPAYQRKYKGNTYPQVEQQRALHTVKNYKYEPREPVVRDHYAQHARPEPPHPQAGGPHGGGPPGEHGR
ncbi:MAG TPA: hypothetical protein VMR31_13550 [Myxococcota bacterium]|nr:hypothetical protein [Myxococcota bacterium]